MSPDSEEGTETRCAEKKDGHEKKIVTIVIAMMTADPDLCLSVFLCVCLCPSLCLCALAFQGETGLSRVQHVQAARRFETGFNMLSKAFNDEMPNSAVREPAFAPDWW